MMLQVRSKLPELNATSSNKNISNDDKDTIIAKENPILAGSLSSLA